MEEKLFCGNGKRVTDWKIGISVCLDDIPPEFINVSERNGKRYVNINVVENREGENRFGKTHYLEVNTWKPDRERAEAKPHYPPAQRTPSAPPPMREPVAPKYDTPWGDDLEDDIPF